MATGHGQFESRITSQHTKKKKKSNESENFLAYKNEGEKENTACLTKVVAGISLSHCMPVGYTFAFSDSGSWQSLATFNKYF